MPLAISPGMINYQPHYTNSWALIIGINTYQFASPLTFARNDADAVASILVSDLGFEASRLFLLKDSEATKQAILDHYLELSSLATNPDDRVLVFFAGHGFTTRGLRGEIGYLVPVDGDKDKLNSLIRWEWGERNKVAAAFFLHRRVKLLRKTFESPMSIF